PPRVALWIDTEGKAYEVIEGAAGLSRRVHLLHVEVETSACIAAAQRLYPDVRSLLESMGFEEIATDQVRTSTQFNAVFVRGELPMRVRMRVTIALVCARTRWLLVAVCRRLCPGCVRRYHAWRIRQR
ncbi:MAG: FkbM family methyltransferase, partial [Mycobacteriales bacterium]